MANIGVLAFLKNLEKSTPQKITEYLKYLEPGGYGGFYAPLRQAARAVALDGATFASQRKIIQAIEKANERKHNRAAFDQLEKLVLKYGICDFFVAPTSSLLTPKKNMSLRLSPDFGGTIDGKRFLFKLAYTKDATVAARSQKIARRLFEKYLCVDAHADCSARILDLKRKSIFSESGDPLVMDLIVDAEFSLIDTIFENHKQKNPPQDAAA
jgi:hypothetical protein